ncbi:hypothetical protein NX059_010353 [Plenodomus lindquistii]|nr:hypothetical protein NX059_010353 [Plenodomus lindquistii]
MAPILRIRLRPRRLRLTLHLPPQPKLWLKLRFSPPTPSSPPSTRTRTRRIYKASPARSRPRRDSLTTGGIPATPAHRPSHIDPSIPVWTPPSHRRSPASPASSPHALANRDNEGMLDFERVVLAQEREMAQREEEEAAARVRERERERERSEMPTRRTRRKTAGVFPGPHGECKEKGVHRCGGA